MTGRPVTDSPGTDAIDAYIDRLDGGEAAHRYHPQAPHRFQRGGPLHAVTTHVVRGDGDDPSREAAGGVTGAGAGGRSSPDHWHLVTYGLSELDAKESDDPSTSGWGFELTFRLAGLDEEPLWAVDFLTNLAAYVWSSGLRLADGHHVDLRGPIRIGTTSPITAAAIVRDPVLGVLAGPFGEVEFLQVVGLTADELELCRAWSTEGVLGFLERHDPLLVTVVDRPSVLADRAQRAEIGRRAADDGSALTELRVGTLRWRQRRRRVVVTMGAGAATALGTALTRELIASGASFRLAGNAGEVQFLVADEPTWRADAGSVVIGVPLAGVATLAGLFTGAVGMGRPPGYRGLSFHVVP